jgi:glutamate-1-semialdehyde 2,1-aminomutase
VRRRPQTASEADRSLARSAALDARARAVLAGGVSSSFRSGQSPLPLFIERAEGTQLIDADGNVYVDYICGYGPVILGHGDPAVSEAVCRATAAPQQTGLRTLAELELAERLCALVPSFERIRLANSGSEAVQGALRAARAATGRQLIVKFDGHYHGWLDGIYSGVAPLRPDGDPTTGQSLAAAAGYLSLPWNESSVLEQLFAERGTEIAAVIMEPLPCNGGVFAAAPGYLERARALTRAYGALLIFDEVISGFRLGLAGMQGRSGVIPDLSVVAKAMANGYPISAFGGNAEAMGSIEDNVAVHGGTYNGGASSVSAALATLARLEDETSSFYDRLDRLGRELMSEIVAAGNEAGFSVRASGPGSVFQLWFSEDEITDYGGHLRADHARYRQFAQALLNEGVAVLPSGRWHLSGAHGEAELDGTLAAVERAFRGLSAQEPARLEKGGFA